MAGTDRITEPTVSEVRQIADGVEIDLLLPDGLYYFEGHFPGRPILPGVVQIDWAVLFADRYLDTDIGAAQNFQVKFMSIIEPGQRLSLVLRYSADRKRLMFEYRAKEALSSGSVALKDGR